MAVYRSVSTFALIANTDFGALQAEEGCCYRFTTEAEELAGADAVITRHQNSLLDLEFYAAWSWIK